MSKRKVKLTESEKAFIKEQIEAKLDSLHKELNVEHPESELSGKDYNIYFVPKHTAINKLDSDFDSFTPSEIYNINAAVERNKSPECEKSNLISFENPLDWLDISDKLKEKMDECDFLTRILIKTGYFDGSTEKRKMPFLYGDVLRFLSDMMESKKICLSINDPLDIYKIGFLNQRNELLAFGLKRSIDLRELQFSNYHGKVKETMSDFSKCVSKEDAYVLLSRVNKQNYPSNNIEFLLKLLK